MSGMPWNDLYPKTPPVAAAPAPPPWQESVPPPWQDQYGPGATKPVSSDPSLTGQALSAFGDILKGPVLTSAVRGVGGLVNAASDPYGTALAPVRKMISPEEEARYQKAEPPGPGTRLGDAFFRSTGIPEYQPTSAPERILMSGGEAGIAGAPFGVGGALLGALSGTAGQSVREAGGGERAATVAEVVPGLFAAGREARRGPAIPTATELRDSGRTRLRAFTDAPVELSPAPLASMSAAAEPVLMRGGFRLRNAPDTFDLLDELRRPNTGGWATGTPGPGGVPSLNMGDLQAIRESLNTTIKDNRSPLAAHPKDFAAAADTLGRLDDVIENMPNNPAHLTAGTPADAAAAIDNFRTGRADYLAAMNLNRLTGELGRGRGGVVQQVEDKTAAANSGANYDNTLRGQVRVFRKHEPNSIGLSDDSLAALDRVVAGGAISNRIRDAANFLGGGRGLGTLVTGTLTSGPAALSGRTGLATALGVGIPALGIGLKGLENHLASRRLNTALDTVAMDSPLYRERAANFTPDYAAIGLSLIHI